MVAPHLTEQGAGAVGLTAPQVRAEHVRVQREDGHQDERQNRHDLGDRHDLVDARGLLHPRAIGMWKIRHLADRRLHPPQRPAEGAPILRAASGIGLWLRFRCALPECSANPPMVEVAPGHRAACVQAERPDSDTGNDPIKEL
jgi:hypothetical protein